MKKTGIVYLVLARFIGNMQVVAAKLTIVVLLSLFASGLAAAQEKITSETSESKQRKVAREFITHHKIKIGAEVLNYVAIAGDTIVQNGDGQQQASIFSISYLREDSERRESRPITFLFNGGPGSSAVWLHLGAFGPRRLILSSDPANPGGPPYQLSDNPHTILPATDLVFVDPVGTGYSHALGQKKDKDYWGVDEDSQIMADFIRTYLTKHNRWNSPKYLAGESYGTLRVSLLIRDLSLKLLNPVFFNGVVLLSTATDVRIFLNGDPANELPYVTNLPTYAATAYYHNALPERPENLDLFLREVEAFASSEYLTALFQGDSLPADRQTAIAKKLHAFTGLDTDYLKQTRNRIDRNRFLKQLLRHRGIVLAAHDTRFAGKDFDEAGEYVETDPFLFGIAGPFVSAINNYLINELKVKTDEEYIVFTLEANQTWKRPSGSNHVFDGFLNTTSYLTRAALTNKDFRVFAASGLHDLTTTYFGTKYVFDHSGIDKERVVLRNYVGGHMMYLDSQSLQQLSADITAFISSALR